VVDYALRDPADSRQEAEEKAMGDEKLTSEAAGARPSFKRAHRQISNNLYAINPIMMNTLYLWARKYRYQYIFDSFSKSIHLSGRSRALRVHTRIPESLNFKVPKCSNSVSDARDYYGFKNRGFTRLNITKKHY
jgi:hypothetical protein